MKLVNILYTWENAWASNIDPKDLYHNIFVNGLSSITKKGEIESP
jgi:hypothetical protein